MWLDTIHAESHGIPIGFDSLSFPLIEYRLDSLSVDIVQLSPLFQILVFQGRYGFLEVLQQNKH